jgi:phage-related minor tail protein
MAKGSAIKGINIEIGGNTGPLDKALADVNVKSSHLQTELREVEKLLKLDPTNTELLAQKQKLLTSSVEKTNEKLTALKDAEKQVQEQFKEGKVSEEQYRALQREIIKTEQDLKKIEDQAKKTNNALSSDQAIGNLKNMGKAAGVAALGVGVAAVGMGVAAINSADELQKLSDQTGLTAERLQELQYAGNNLGVDLETITGAQAKLTKSMAGAKDGTGAQAEAFAALGISVVDSNGEMRDAKEVMAEAFTALNGVGNETERDALAMQIFGKSAMELNPLIKAGGDELNRLSKEAQDNGAVMSDEAVAGLDSFGDTLDNIKTSILGGFGESLSKILPDIQVFLNKLIELPGWIRENQTLLTVIGIALGTLTLAIVAYNIAAGWAAITTGVMTAAATAFGAVMAFITSPITLIVLAIGALIAIGVLLYKNFDEIKEFAAKAWDAISKKVGESLTAAMNKIKEWGTNVLNWITKDVPGFISKIVGFFAGLPGKLTEELKKALTAIGNWITNGVTKAKTEVPKIITAIKDAFINLPKDMLKVGGNIVQGIWDGIVGMTQWLKDKVATFASGIVDGIKSALKINSPSGVFRDEVGKYMAQGVGVGFENEMANVSPNMAKAIPVSGKDYVGDSVSGKSSMNHTGTIRVEGVNTKGELVGAYDIIVDRFRRELRMG